MWKLTQQHNFKCNSQQKYRTQLYVDAVYHMNDNYVDSLCYKDLIQIASYIA